MSTVKNKSERLYEVIKRPIITEKTAMGTSEGQYSFEVVLDANKIEIKKAIEALYPGRKVKKVHTLHIPSHQKRFRNKIGRTKAGKKAVVSIEGEPIQELIGA